MSLSRASLQIVLSQCYISEKDRLSQDACANPVATCQHELCDISSRCFEYFPA